MRGAVSIRKREWSYYNPENFDSEYRFTTIQKKLQNIPFHQNANQTSSHENGRI